MAGPGGSFQLPGEAAAASSVTAAEPPVIGKRELLQWVREILGDTGEDIDFSTLRLGHVFLRLFDIIWPDVTQALPFKGCLHPETPADVAANWEVIEEALRRVQVPLSFVNQALIRAGNFGACYQALVFLFFLYCLARDHECEFVLAHAVEPALTAFMSSEAPLACLVSGGAVELPPPLKEKIVTPRAPPAPSAARPFRTSIEGRGPRLGRAESQASFTHPSVRLEGTGMRHLEQQQPPPASPHRLEASSPASKEVQSLPLSSTAQAERSLPAFAKEAKAISPAEPRVVGGAFSSDGSFRARQAAETRSAALPEQQQTSSRKDAQVQTLGSSPLEAQEWQQQLPPLHTPLEWCGEGQKIKGEQLIEMLRYQNELLQQQLSRAADEVSLLRRHHEQQLRDLKEAAAVELQRAKEKSNAALVEQQAKHSSAIQAMRHQLDMRIRQIEDDVTIDIEVLCSSSSVKTAAQSAAEEERLEKNHEGAPGGFAALEKVKKLQELVEERLRARESAANELQHLLQETQEQCAAYRRESDSRWSQWTKCEGLKAALMQLVSCPQQQPARSSEASDPLAAARQAINEELQRLLDHSGFSVSRFSALEQKLLATLIEALCVQRAQQAKHSQESLELARRLHQAQKSQGRGDDASSRSNIATMQKELLLEEQVRRLEAQNQRLARTSDYLRLKVEHLAKWKAEEEALATQQRRRSSAGAASASQEGEGLADEGRGEGHEEEDKGETETLLPPVLLQQSAEIIDRDAELLQALKGLGRRSDATFTASEDQAQNHVLIDDSGVRTPETETITISAAMKKRLLQLFWLLLGDFYKFKVRLEESQHQLLRMQQLVRTLTEEKASAERATAKEKTELVSSFEAKMQKERSLFQKLMGRSLVKLLAAQEQAACMQKVKNKQEEEHEALLQLVHQADHKRFNAILAKVHAVQMTNRVMQKREHFWNELAKALSTQLSSPSEKTQRAIQDLWLQLAGSKALIASDLMELSSDTLSLQLSEVDRALSEGAASTPRSSCVSARAAAARTAGAAASAAAKASPRGGTARLAAKGGLRPRDSSSSGALTTKAAGRPLGARVSSMASTRGPAAAAAAAAQTPAEEADGWGQAEAFEKCLREICCNAPVDELQQGVSRLEGSSLEAAFSAMHAGSDSEEEGPQPGAAFVQQLFAWKGKETLETQSSDLPRDWVGLLKLMAQEATALFRKHKTLVDKEVSELKREQEAQLEKQKKLMLQLSDQQAACSSFREQQAFFQRQHQLALEALERLQEEKALMATQHEAVERALRKEAAELRITQEEMRKALAAVASQAADSPFVLALCTPHLTASGDFQGRGCFKPQQMEQTREAREGGPHEAACSRGDVEARDERPQDPPARGVHTHAQKEDRGPRSASHGQGGPPSVEKEAHFLALLHRTKDFELEQRNESCWKQQTSPTSQRRGSCFSSGPVDTRATTEGTADWRMESLSTRSHQLEPASHRPADEGSCGRKFQDAAAGGHRDRGSGGETPASTRAAEHAATARPRLVEAMLSGDREHAYHLSEAEEAEDPYRSGNEEANRVPSTSLPSPRSPPRAALAPLVSPSRLVHALRMQLLTPKADRSGEAHPHRNAGGEKSSNTDSLRQQTAPSCSSYKESRSQSSLPMPQKVASPFPGKKVLRYPGHAYVESESHAIRRTATEAGVKLRAELAPEQRGKSAAETGVSGDALFSERSGGFTMERASSSRSNSSRAAAEQAWEEFVEAYGTSRQKQSASTHRSVDQWLPIRMPSSRRGTSSSEQDASESEGPASSFLGAPTKRRDKADSSSLTRETTDSALQDVLKIEEELKDEELIRQKTDSEEAFAFQDSTRQLGASATTFLRRLGTQLETSMRVSSTRPHPHLN
ncbi:hypothetical protein Esti_001826 [Eimeria stiedai]